MIRWTLPLIGAALFLSANGLSAQERREEIDPGAARGDGVPDTRSGPVAPDADTTPDARTGSTARPLPPPSKISPEIEVMAPPEPPRRPRR